MVKLKIDMGKLVIGCEVCKKPLTIMAFSASKIQVYPCETCLENAKLQGLGFKKVRN